MSISKSLRENIRYFGITLPIDRRTKEYKEIIQTKNINEKTYVELLRKQVKEARAKEQKRVKKMLKDLILLMVYWHGVTVTSKVNLKLLHQLIKRVQLMILTYE